MALSADQKKKLEKLSIENEGVAFVGKKAKATTNPTIVLSLGGIGGEALGELKRKFRKEVGKAENVHFLAIDTCEEDLDKRRVSKKESGTLEDSETISVYDNGIRDILKHDRRPTYLTKWLSDEFPEYRLDDQGAQGIRQIGRVMLVCSKAYDRIQQKLASFIDSFSQGGTPPHVEVILIAGISGGTGSGSIIDVSYLVHRVMEANNIIDYGFGAYVFTPDVQFNVQGIRGKDSILSNLKKNGYAALKEIDYFMNLENHGGHYELDRGVNTWSCSRNIYTACTIVSGIAELGGMITKEATIRNLTESLLDTLTDVEMGAEDGSDIQMATAFSSNRRNNLAAWYRNEGSDPKSFPRSANYVYQILGYSSVSIPKNEILAYCVNRMFQEVTNEFNRIDLVDRNMVNTVLSHAQLSDEGEYANFALALDPNDPIQTRIMYPMNQFPSKAEVKNRTDNVLDNARALAMDEANKALNQRWQAQLKNTLINSLETDINKIFEHSGPYFVVELLTHTLDKPMAQNDPRQPFSGVLEALDQTRIALVERANSSRGYSSKANVRQQLETLADDASGLLSGKSKMQAYVDFCCNVAVQDVLVPAFYEVLANVLLTVENELIDTNNKIWNVYTDVLTEVGHILEKDAQAVTDPKKHDNTYSFSVVNLYEVNSKTNQLRKYLDDFVSPQSVNMLCQAFIKSMRDKRADWTEMVNNQNFDVVKEVRAIFDSCLSSVLKTDIVEKFVVAAYSPNQLTPADIDKIWKENGPEKSKALNAAAKEIVYILKNRGGLMARLDGASDTSFFSKNIVATLDDTPALSQEIIAEYNNPEIVPAKSKGLTKYFASRLVFNLPLCLIAGFQDYDEAYRKNADSMGLHMSESDDPSLKVDWRRLPQPFIIDVAARRDPNYETFFDYQVLMDVKKKADEAIEKYHFLYLKGSNMNWYSLRNVEKMPEDFSEFRDKAGELLDEDLEAEISDELLKDSGFVFREVQLTMQEHDLLGTDREGKQSVVQVGDLYKLIRMSTRYMDLLDKNLKIYQDIYTVFNQVKEEKQAGQAFASNLRAFINALKAGVIVEAKSGVWTYSVRDKKDILVDLHAEGGFDKDHFLYHLFREFCKLDKNLLAVMRREVKAMITGDEDVSEIRDRVKELLGPDYLGDLFAKDDVNEEAKASDLDYSFIDDPKAAKTSYQVLLRYYKMLQKQLR